MTRIPQVRGWRSEQASREKPAHLVSVDSVVVSEQIAGLLTKGTSVPLENPEGSELTGIILLARSSFPFTFDAYFSATTSHHLVFAHPFTN